jgi:hypothetical protein
MSNGSLYGEINDFKWLNYYLQYGSLNCNKCSSDYVAIQNNASMCL